VRSDVAPAAAQVVSAGQANSHPRARLFVGAALIATGLLVAGASNRVSNTVRVGVVATALSVVGIAVVLGPWIAGLVQSATEERRQRIRAQEREAVAAHLHDSVLQTLALIQRTADDPRRTASLARQQEHELRAWLYGDDTRVAGSFAAAIEAVGRDVELRYDVRVDVVVVGDAVIDDPLAALVAATREACVNAAKHSGESRIAVYAEGRDDLVEVFVRDRGVGFDRADLAVDRRGIAGSIEARMATAGGSSMIDSAPGSGTEVQLRLPRATMSRTVSS
jgi:signal transduction histidine kinase